MDDVTKSAVQLAGELAVESALLQTRPQRREAERLARMMVDSVGKDFTFALVDQVFRSHDRQVQANRFRALVRRFGVPVYFSTWEGILLKSAAVASQWFPEPVMAGIENRLRADSARVILPGEPEPLARYLAKRKAAGIHVNLNYLGEAVLGEEEANRRLNAILTQLSRPDVRCVSVKISAIFSQISLIDWDGTLSQIKDRLRQLYRAALPERKLVYLDMEEYRDLQLTLAAFQQVLDENEFQQSRAGMALQAYLPDSWIAQQQLTQWAQRRISTGGAPVRLRLVKGANLAMENVEAELHNWNAAPYSSKVETDANYSRMLEFGCEPESAQAVHLGVASHNLFDVALALILREKSGTAEFVELEMLEGMANHQARAVQARAGGLLVYAPIVKRSDFFSAIAYLVRRLDENTAPGNFLREMFELNVGSESWEEQRKQFITGWEGRSNAPINSRRALPLSPSPGLPRALSSGTPGKGRGEDDFQNTPDTDWTQKPNRDLLHQTLQNWNPSQLPPLEDFEQILSQAQSAQPEWESIGWSARSEILRRCAKAMSNARSATIVEMMHEGKKSAAEADIEVSEAIDFANYTASIPQPPENLHSKPLGLVVITPPWNFPYAIPAGGVLAALMAGNAVILKPAPETVTIAYHLATHLWSAGVSKNVLKFFPCPDGEIGKALITDSRISAVVLTGAYETAQMFLRWRPSLKLFAETSGKNAIIITAQADRDLAIKDLVRSAFGHSGQKCSAASLAILEAEIYDDLDFRRALCDAAKSLRVGSSLDLANVVTALIREAHPALVRALTNLDDGEHWLLQPKPDEHDPCLWSPGIKLGIKPQSFFHQTECFGPVLGLMRAENLDQAVEFQNTTPFGLTGGIHSLDDSEIEFWKSRVQVGNAYINRPITGAIVRRQPFGGWKRSSVGPGIKAGGPNYVSLFSNFENSSNSTDNFEESWRTYFLKQHDPSNLRSESNQLRYRPINGVILRTSDDETIARATSAAKICRVVLHLSHANKESESELMARLPALANQAEVFRTTTEPSNELLTAVHAAGLKWVSAPILTEGRYELPRWLREQSVSQTRHRYGQITRNISPFSLSRTNA